MTPPLRVRGMQDIFGEYQRYFTFLKKVARHEFRKNGFTWCHDFKLIFAQLVRCQQRFVFPGDQHITDTTLNEGIG